MCEGGAEAEVAACEGMWVDVVDKSLSVDDVAYASVDGFESDVVSVVALQQMVRVRVFSQYDRSEPCGVGGGRIACIAAEACGSVPVAAIAHVVEAEGIVVGKLASVSSAAVCHPKAVEVAYAW